MNGRWGWLVVAAIGVGGCQSPDDTGDTDTMAPCSPSYTAFPADGETDAFYRTTVAAQLQVPDPTASIALFDANGAAVAGTSATVGERVAFTPAAPLHPGETYVARIPTSSPVPAR